MNKIIGKILVISALVPLSACVAPTHRQTYNDNYYSGSPNSGYGNNGGYNQYGNQSSYGYGGYGNQNGYGYGSQSGYNGNNGYISTYPTYQNYNHRHQPSRGYSYPTNSPNIQCDRNEIPNGFGGCQSNPSRQYMGGRGDNSFNDDHRRMRQQEDDRQIQQQRQQEIRDRQRQAEDNSRQQQQIQQEQSRNRQHEERDLFSLQQQQEQEQQSRNRQREEQQQITVQQQQNNETRRRESDSVPNASPQPNNSRHQGRRREE